MRADGGIGRREQAPALRQVKQKTPLANQGALLLCIHFSVPSRAVYSRGVIPNRRLNRAIKWDWEEKPRL